MSMIKWRIGILAVIPAILILFPSFAIAYSEADLGGTWSVQFSGSQSRWTVSFNSSGEITDLEHNRYETHSFNGQFTVQANGTVTGTVHRVQTDDTGRRFTADDRVTGGFDSTNFMDLAVNVTWSYDGGGGTQVVTYSSEWTKQGAGPVDPTDPDFDFENSIGMKFKLIPAGSFIMGSNEGDSDEKPIHQVEITKPFYLGVFEVTQLQWRTVMGDNPSEFKGNNRPVEQISWYDVQEFIQELKAKEEGINYRLPTEAEWEYACRAGTTTKYGFGNDASRLGEFAWYGVNSGDQTHSVGQKNPNNFALYDMHGNVQEWCQDWFQLNYYGQSAKEDPKGPNSGSTRVLRSGYYSLDSSKNFRSANRHYSIPEGWYDNVGFRLAIDGF